MSLPRLRQLVASAALAGPLTFFSAAALAAPSLEVKAGEVVILEGTASFDKVTVHKDGVLRVRPVTPGVVGSGSLLLKANEIVVAEGGLIDASAAGFAGTDAEGGAPACCPAASGGAGLTGDTTSPGGGGGSGGKGAPGCLNGPGTGGLPGQAYASPENGNPGAAGGAAFFVGAPGDIPNRGGRGGGALTLRAALVTIAGTIRADGADGVAFAGTGTGGGAGGFIRIDAVTVSGTGLVSARGGAGAPGFSSTGGAGGGGWIRISTTSPDGTTAVSTDVQGGETSAVHAACADGDDGIAVVVDDPAAGCIDADEDGDPSVECSGGTDCDDADPTVRGANNPALEICDGKDNDCNDSTDDDLHLDACPAGQTCNGGACVDEGAGGAGGGSAEPEPDYLDYRGACSAGASRAAHGGAAACLAAAVVALLASARARRRKR